MPTKTEWKAQAILKAAEGVVEKRMERACIVVRDQVKVLVNRGNPTGKDPSLPGEPPKKVSGRFFGSVSYRVVHQGEAVIGQVGSDVPYQPRLELGFVGADSLGRVYHQAPRPAFRPALTLQQANIRKIFGMI